MTPALVYTARSHLGMVRHNNEDSAYAGPRLLALADGMGGHAAGEIASQFVVASFARLDEDDPGQDLTGALARALTEGNNAIAAHVDAHPETEGMGCTATALLFDGRRMGLIHVGDSRAYLLREGTLSQITKDDTFVQSLVDRGELSAEEAHNHPRRSLILKALTGEPVDPTVVTREARVGDRYLLCSDGLSDPVSTETIAETMSTGTVDDAADRLIRLALRSGGPDNITVVLADVVESPRDAPSMPVVAGAASADEPGDEDGDPDADTAAGRAAAFSRARVAAQNPDAEDDTDVDDEEDDPEPPRGSRWRFVVSVIGVLILLAGIVGVSALLVRSNYFVTDQDSQVVVKRGISGDVFGITLASVSRVACLSSNGELTLHEPDQFPQGCDVFTLGDLREPARESVRAGLPSGSLDEADAQVTRLAQDNLLPPCSELEAEADAEAEAERDRDAERREPHTGDDDSAGGADNGASDEGAEDDGDDSEPTHSRPAPTPMPGQNCRAGV